MNFTDKLHADLNDATVSLGGVNAFSTKDKLLVGLMVLFPMAINNLFYWYLQCLLITQLTVVIFGYIVAPLVLRKLINKDVYVLLDVRETMSGIRPALGWVWIILALGIPVLFLIIGMWFDLIGIHYINLLGPLFSRTLFNYAYIIACSVLFCLVHPFFEARFYYGVLDSIIPGNILGRVILALLLTINYIGFSFAVVGTNYSVAIALAIIFATYFVVAYISLHKGVKIAIFIQMTICVVSWALFLLFLTLKRDGNYTKGVTINWLNPRNILN